MAILAIGGIAAFLILGKQPAAEPETTVATTAAETQTAPATTAAAPAVDMSYEGTWTTDSGRMTVEITKSGDSYYVNGFGSNSAEESMTRTMSCALQDGSLRYSDGRYTRNLDKNGGSASLLEYENESGFFELVTQGDISAYKNADVGNYEVIYLAKEWTGSGENMQPSGDAPYLVWTNDGYMQKRASDEYIIWYSGSILLQDEDLSALTKEEIRVARNEIYARHGRKFTSEDLQVRFNNCSWYNGTIEPSNFNENQLSDTEKKNVKFLENAENAKASSGTVTTTGNPLTGLVANDIMGWYVADKYNPNSYYSDVYSEAYSLGLWAGNVIGYANSTMQTLSDGIGRSHEWLFGTDISNNITNNFPRYYAYYFALKDYYNSNGTKSVEVYNSLKRNLQDWGITGSAADQTIQQLFNDIQPLITESNNVIRSKRG